MNKYFPSFLVPLLENGKHLVYDWKRNPPVSLLTGKKTELCTNLPPVKEKRLSGAKTQSNTRRATMVLIRKKKEVSTLSSRKYAVVSLQTPLRREDRKGKSYGAATTLLVGTRSIGPPLHHQRRRNHRHSTHHHQLLPLQKLSDRAEAIDPTVSRKDYTRNFDDFKET